MCGRSFGWYLETFGTAPNYSDLLAQIAKEPAERTQLLRAYFEPTPDERERGIKTPTIAHEEIARLVSKGYIRVIVTTNFDRLVETALETAGVVPTVISSPDSAVGALPLVHTSCCVVKIHGDYMDTRIRNTPKELAEYDPRINGQLDRILDEFGLIVCGWSAEWDSALRAALERCPNRRFTTFWAAHGALTAEAKTIIAQRRAQVVPIISADTFFHDVFEKVESLEQLAGPHPLSAKVATATVKRYLVDARHKIDLHDQVTTELEKIVPLLSPSHFPLQGGFSAEELTARLKRYETFTEILRALVTTGCYWGTKDHMMLWTKVLERLANAFTPANGLIVWINLRLYPSLLLMYAGGLAAVAAGAYDTFGGLLTKPRIRNDNSEDVLVKKINAAGSVTDSRAMKQLPAVKNHKTPVSDYLCEVLREQLREFLPGDVEYERCFDRFEYLLGLVYVDIANSGDVNNDWAPVGRFIWRNEFAGPESRIAGQIKLEAEAAGEDWAPLKAGLFSGSTRRFKEVQAAFETFLARVSPSINF